MALSLRIPLTPPTIPPKSQKTYNFSCFSTGKHNKISNTELESDLRSEMAERINTQLKERENAMKNSKQLLFFDLCEFLKMKPEEAKMNWRKMNPDEKMGLVKGFVCDWGLRFHPLSPRSIRDLVDEYVIEDSKLEQNRANSWSWF